MTREQVDHILNQSDRSRQHRGIGLKNIDRRLKRQFGKGLNIYSVAGQGTTVSFEIPKNADAGSRMSDGRDGQINLL
jgi:sensor histidine kinase YesM